MKIELAAFILFVLEASVLGSPPKHVNKRISPFKPPTRIIGGVEVTPHSIPYQAALLINSAFFCGGVLISTKYVLTAAHCTDGIDNIAVVLGKHNIRQEEDTQIIIYDPKIIRHENYSANTFQNDISLIMLHFPIAPTAAIRAVDSLAPKDSGDFVGYYGRVSGWGCTSTGCRSIPSNLRKVYVEIISNKQCVLGRKRIRILGCHVCTSGIDELIGPVGACTGDSGGPLVTGNVLVGLVSFGNINCEAGSPTVYTRISYYREWISSHSGV